MVRFLGPALLLIAALFPVGANGQAPSPRAAPALRVATRVIPPLVSRDPATGKLTGFSIELWRAIAAESKLAFDFVELPKLGDLLDAVRKHDVDLAIAAISITADREEEFDFSQPILEAGLQILVRDTKGDDPSLTRFLSLFASRPVLEMAGLLLVLTVLPAPLLWWVERRRDDGLVAPGAGKAGLVKSMWWAAATLGGQADEMPRSPVGRIIGLVWMFASVLFIGYFTATAASVLTLQKLESEIRGPGDLPGKKIGAIAGSTGASYLRSEGIAAEYFQTLAEATDGLERDEIDAIVYDAPILEFYALHAGRGKVRLAGPMFRHENYGVLLPAGSPLRKQINEALLRLFESGAYRSIHAEWFGKEE